jgi:MFS family permease
VLVSAENTSTPIALFTLFSIYTGIFGSGFVSLFPVVVADLFGAEILASKVGLLNPVNGLGTLAGPRMVYAIIWNGVNLHWGIGVASAGIFMFTGGSTMVATFSWFNKHDRNHQEAYQID